jgi:hypothetical protein
MLFPGMYFFCQDKKLVYNGNCLLDQVLLQIEFIVKACSNEAKSPNLNWLAPPVNYVVPSPVKVFTGGLGETI